MLFGRKYDSVISIQEQSGLSVYTEGNTSKRDDQVPKMIESSVIKVFNLEAPYGSVDDSSSNCEDQKHKEFTSDYYNICLTKREEVIKVTFV